MSFYRDQKEVRINRIHQCVEKVLNFVEAKKLTINYNIFISNFQIDITNGGTCYGGIRIVRRYNIPFVRISTRNEYHNPVQAAKIMLGENAPVYNQKQYNIRLTTAAKLGTGAYIEYASFDKDPNIGGFYSDNVDLHVMAVVCHEIAHAMTCWNSKYGVYEDRRIKPHGPEWKQIYKILRMNFVNPYLPKNHVEVHQQVLAEVKKAAKRMPRKRKAPRYLTKRELKELGWGKL